MSIQIGSISFTLYREYCKNIKLDVSIYFDYNNFDSNMHTEKPCQNNNK